MRSTFPLLAITMALTSAIPALALQNIYIGTIDSCSSGAKYGPEWLVWFTDGPACSTGTQGGPTHYPGSTLCDKNMNILGHDGITFTGCPAAAPYGYPGAPTGVSDGGVPALQCAPVSGVPDQICPNGGCGDVPVKTLYLCEGIKSTCP